MIVAATTLVWVVSGQAGAKENAAGTTSAVVQQADLPQEAQHTLRLIHSGGPFPYSKDGIVFGNREGLLPRKSRGYYHEYTVPTSASRDRGARRVVCGGAQSANPDSCYYSDDHYASFRSIAK